jgi:hypothetical protein
MNYFLMMVIIGLCCGGYYEYTVLDEKVVSEQQQLSDMSGKFDALQSENKKLEDEKAQLKKSVDEAQANIADLTKQVQTAQSALAEAKKQILPPPNATRSAIAPASPPPPIKFGTIATLDGKTFQNCQLLKVDADGIVISYSEGITKLLYGLLPPDLQKRFGYDPHQAAALTAAQIQFQEEQRKAAAQAAGN